MNNFGFFEIVTSSAAQVWRRAAILSCAAWLVFSFGVAAPAQQTNGKAAPEPPAGPQTIAANQPKVTQIEDLKLRELLKPNGKPLLVNFWATWCDPCREEFPDLVKIDVDYRGRLDVITISLDEPVEVNRAVPRFLSQMKAEMPAYLLKAADEGAVIEFVSKDWSGALPFTILYNEKGETAYIRQGKFRTDVLRAEIDKVVAPPAR